MAAPTNPTATSIVTEAYNKVGIDSPTSAQLTRAKDHFLEEIKNDIWIRAGRSGNTRIKSLQTSDVQISVVGQSKYDFPSDFDEEITISILDGDHTGTAQAGASTTITLESGEDAGESDVEGKYILITSGTGVNGLRQCVDYNTSTLVATVASEWDTTPDSTSTYLIVNQTTELEEDNVLSMGGLGNSTFSKGKPTTFMKISEGVNERMVFDIPCDLATYGILLRYYANLNKVDLTEGSTLISKLYLNWREPLVMGVAWKIALDDDDDKQERLEPRYEGMVTQLLAKEMPFGGEFEGFTV